SSAKLAAVSCALLSVHSTETRISAMQNNNKRATASTTRSGLCWLGAALLGLIATVAQAQAPTATSGQLSWMTGNYAGAVGPNTLEENWIGAEAGSISAMVRMIGPNGTSMFEMITIEEVDGSLVLHLQQFDPGFKPRTPEPLEMKLAMIANNHVHFVNTGSTGMKSLGYTLSGDTFTIHVEQPEGQKRDLVLSRRNLWSGISRQLRRGGEIMQTHSIKLRPLALLLSCATVLAACAGTGSSYATATGAREHDSRSFAAAANVSFEALAGARAYYGT